MTVRSLPLKRTFAPLEVGCRPSPASITPDLTSSSLYFVIAPRISVLGISPASDSGLPGTRTMKRIGVSLWWMGWFLPARRTRSAEIDTARNFFIDVRGPAAWLRACLSLRRRAEVGGLPTVPSQDIHGEGTHVRTFGVDDKLTVRLDPSFNRSGHGEVDACFELIREVGERVRRAVDESAVPVVLSGSCFVAVGVVAGLSRPPPAVAWLDAHADF